jgi:pimeloyl-ACP methyl ester carboxylesterase
MGPVARGLADAFRVLEPFQRGSGGECLTVARHVADLQDFVECYCGGARPALVGHSWGAMLALAYASAHPNQVAALVLIGCGTFDEASRGRMREALDARLDEALRQRLRRLPQEIAATDERLRLMGELLLPAYSHDLVSLDQEIAACDARAHEETWDDMVRLQGAGVYPAAFRSITAPVLMLHGAADPHPGPMIRDTLKTRLPQLEYREWARCGHYPWLERAVREEFFATLHDWLGRHVVDSSP